MKAFNIEITNEAINDLERIYLYIANSLLSLEIASGQYERITQNIMKLDTMPERYRLIESEPEHSRGLRIMPVDNYSVIYVGDILPPLIEVGASRSSSLPATA